MTKKEVVELDWTEFDKIVCKKLTLVEFCKLSFEDRCRYVEKGGVIPDDGDLWLNFHENL